MYVCIVDRCVGVGAWVHGCRGLFWVGVWMCGFRCTCACVSECVSIWVRGCLGVRSIGVRVWGYEYMDMGLFYVYGCMDVRV